MEFTHPGRTRSATATRRFVQFFFLLSQLLIKLTASNKCLQLFLGDRLVLVVPLVVFVVDHRDELEVDYQVSVLCVKPINQLA